VPTVVIDDHPDPRLARTLIGWGIPHIAGSSRSAETLAEAGLAGFELVAWQGVVGPAGLPRPIADQLAGQIAKLVDDPQTRAKLTAIALEPLAESTPDSFAAYVKTEIDRWAGIVRNSGAQPE
jgi:tripartite-type tricarboxylate transporter receptor subunit TctC